MFVCARVGPSGLCYIDLSPMDLYGASEDVPIGTHSSISRLRPKIDVGSGATAPATSSFDSLRARLRLALSDDLHERALATLGQGQRDQRVTALDRLRGSGYHGILPGGQGLFMF